MSTKTNTKPAAVDQDEFEAAKKEAEKAVDTYIHKFRKPFSFEGKTYEELTFAWGDLTGEDALAIEDELQAMNKPVIVPTFSGPYLIRMAARACTEKIGEDTIRAMPIAEFNRIRSAARNFLVKSES